MGVCVCVCNPQRTMGHWGPMNRIGRFALKCVGILLLASQRLSREDDRRRRRRSSDAQ